MGQLSINFTTLLKTLSKDYLYKKALQYSKSKYNIKIYNIQSLTPEKITQMYKAVIKKFYQNRQNSSDQGWFQNQLKVFVWTLVGYSFLNNKSIRQFNQQNWSFFSQIFDHRPNIFLEFQGRFLIKTKRKANQWTTDEIQILKKKLGNRWNCIAKQLFIASQKSYFRTPKQCRQKWLNHLDPLKKRSMWTVQEDEILLGYVRQQGKKWSIISRILKNTRTEHMVKNRYKSLILNLQKQHKTAGQNQILDKLLQNIQNNKLKDEYSSNEGSNSMKIQKPIEIRLTGKKSQFQKFSTIKKTKIDEQSQQNSQSQYNPQSQYNQQNNYNQKDYQNFEQIMGYQKYQKIQEQVEEQEIEGTQFSSLLSLSLSDNNIKQQFSHLGQTKFLLKRQMNTLSSNFDIEKKSHQSGIRGMQPEYCPFFQEYAQDESVISFMNDDSLFSSLISKDEKDHKLDSFFFF